MSEEKSLPVYFTEERIKKLTEQFVGSVGLIVRTMKKFAAQEKQVFDISASCIWLSQPELESAFREAESDLQFLMTRRGFKPEQILSEGLAEGKIAGILAFRLLRHRIVHVGTRDEVIRDKRAGRIQELAVLRLVSGAILTVNFEEHPFMEQHGSRPRPWLLHELLYLIARRHFNQETLALIFDTAVRLRKVIGNAQPATAG